MTNPLDSQAFPNTPPPPSSSPQGYVTPATIPPSNKAPVTPEKVASYRKDFIELILREVVRAVTGAFFPGASGAADQLTAWATGVFNDIGSLFGAFGGIDLTNPNAIIAWLERMVFGDPGVVNPGFPYEFPVEFTATLTPLQKFFSAIRDFVGIIDFDWELGDFDIEATIRSFIQRLIPFNLLAIPGDLAELADNILAGFEGLPFIGFLFGPVRDAVAAIFGNGMSNSAQIAALQAVVQAPGAGTAWTEEFDGPFRSAPPSKFLITYSGSGTGNPVLSGSGTLMWDPGYSVRTAMLINTTQPLTLTTQYVALVLANNPGFDSNPPEAFLVARSDATGANCVRVDVTVDSTRVQVVVGGVVTTIGDPWVGVWSNGAKFELFAGVGGNDRRYRVLLNGSQILDVTEPSPISVLTNYYAGVGLESGVGGFFGSQISPPQIYSATAGDRA